MGADVEMVEGKMGGSSSGGSGNDRDYGNPSERERDGVATNNGADLKISSSSSSSIEAVSRGRTNIVTLLSRQNRYFGCSMAISIFVGIVFFMGRLYDTPSELSFASQTLYGSADDDYVDEAKDGDTIQTVGDHDKGFNDWRVKQGKSYINKGTSKHSNNNGKRGRRWPDIHSEIQGWLNGTVTKDDGVMYEIQKRLVHDPKAFTEGLTFGNGRLYESTGLTGHSMISSLNPFTGDILETYPMESKYFGEGLTVVKGRFLVQLTYKKKIGFIYDIHNFTTPIGNFTYTTTTGEGWGFTYDNNKNELIVSDGSSNIHFWNADTMEFIRTVSINKRIDGITSVRWINELEYFRGRILANIWFEDTIVVINPETGVIEKEYDFSNLWPQKERKLQGAEVLNGISVAFDPRFIFITGKQWDRMFLVRLLWNDPE